ncbi:MAG: DUF4280 domain-containing protein [Clostridia bacterium]|nr:DUF4280 domain-containing protein [Clostridia bacterium]
MSRSYVVQTATLECSCGDSKSSFKVPIEHKIYINDKPQGNIMDHKPNLNIYPFGMCSSRANPAVIANKYRKVPCVPVTMSPWINGKTDVDIDGHPAILNTSKLMCKWCGTISVTKDGQ